MKRFIGLLFILSLSCSLFSQDIERLLFEMPNVIFEEIACDEGFEKCFELKIKQALDHQAPENGHFYQKVYLSHKGFDQPTVIVTEGYNRNSSTTYELTDLLSANQIDVEHRYCGESLPEEMDYQYLNLKQSCSDYHYIKELFSDIYKKSWVSTGISKGGATTIFYRYFYPDDVEVSVPYVAPINNAFEDKRIYKFLDQVGTKTCRKKILSLQKNMLSNREEVLTRLHWYSKGKNYHYDYLSEEAAFEYMVLEYPFAFWQLGASCQNIPETSASLDDQLNHLLKAADIGLFSDEQIEYYGSHYYQAATEMGYYGYETRKFKKLLKALPQKPNPHAAFVPDKMKVDFDGNLLKQVAKWLAKDGDKFIYIYGSNDTWTATAVPEKDKVDALWFFMEGKHHGNARIKNMEEKDKKRLLETLDNWLGIND